MSATLRDVATAANVSLTTVSRVLNNKSDVALNTVELVERVITELGYDRGSTRRGRPVIPHALGIRHIASSIALLFPTKASDDSQTPLIGQLVDGIETVAREGGFHLLMARFFPGGDLPLCLNPVQVDGLIVRSPSRGLETPLPPVPTVWVFQPGFGPAPGDIVEPDNERFAQIGANYLLERGHRNVAVLNFLPEHPASRPRIDSFLRYAKAMGMMPFVTENSQFSIDEVIVELLGHTPRITGIFLPFGLHFVERVSLALQRQGVRYGDDMDLISSNEYLLPLDPRLATIDIQARELGRSAAEILLWRIQHPKEHRRRILVEPRLVKPRLTLS